MARIPAKICTRITQQVKKFQKTACDAAQRDINESDTSRMVAEMLGEIMGYDKLNEVTGEYAVRGAYADLAVKVGNDIRFFVEVKAANTTLKETHVTQVVNYGANQGVDWAVLTNGVQWQAYKINFGKPVERTLTMEVDLNVLSAKDDAVIEFFGNLSREVFTSSSMTEVFRAKQAMSRYSIAALLSSDPVVSMVRRELRRIAPGLNPDPDDISAVITNEVIKRELIESEEAQAASKFVKRAISRSKREREKDRAPKAAAVALKVQG